MKKLLGFVAAVGMSCLAPTIASASIINFGFENNGTFSKTSCGSIACYVLETTGTATDTTDGVAGTSSWSFTGQMIFFGGAGFGLDTTGAGGGDWTFIDSTSGNNLAGTFGWGLFDGTGLAKYVINSGTGLFAGAWGSGSSVISITKWYSDLPEFHETQGVMTVHTPTTPVSEPSVTGLAALGLAMVGFAAFRRRRVDVTRS